MTIASKDTPRLAAAVGRRLRAMAARFRHLAPRKQCAPARDLSHPELYRLSVRPESADDARQRRNDLSVGAEHRKSAQAYLPIGPSCC